MFEEADIRRCSVKKLFLKMSKNSQENTCARVYFLIKLQASACEFCEISKKTFSYRTPLVTASVFVGVQSYREQNSGKTMKKNVLYTQNMF